MLLEFILTRIPSTKPIIFKIIYNFFATNTFIPLLIIHFLGLFILSVSIS